MFFYYINDIIGNKWSDALRAKNGWTFFVSWFLRFACPPFSTQPAVRQLRHRLDPVQLPFALVSTLVPCLPYTSVLYARTRTGSFLLDCSAQ